MQMSSRCSLSEPLKITWSPRALLVAISKADGLLFIYQELDWLLSTNHQQRHIIKLAPTCNVFVKSSQDGLKRIRW